jgi:hypothetical protein
VEEQSACRAVKVGDGGCLLEGDVSDLELDVNG